MSRTADPDFTEPDPDGIDAATPWTSCSARPCRSRAAAASCFPRFPQRTKRPSSSLSHPTPRCSSTGRSDGRTCSMRWAGSPVAQRRADGGRVQLGMRDAASDRVGVTQAGKILLVVIDGRQPRWSIGPTAFEFARIMADLDAVTALNLDGGGSSEMVVDGEVVNRPSDGHERARSATRSWSCPGRTLESSRVRVDRAQRFTVSHATKLSEPIPPEQVSWPLPPPSSSLPLPPERSSAPPPPRSSSSP